MLAIADAFGNVFAAIPGLASVANVSIESTEKAVANLLAPDPYSRTKDFEGRRVEEIDGGWHILNYGKYRKMMDEEERREYKAKWAREKRRQSRTNVDSSRPSKTANGQGGHIPSASSSKFACTEEEAEKFCESLGLPKSDGTAMVLHWQEKKWPKDWKLTIRKWKSFGYLPSQKAKSGQVKSKEPAPIGEAYRIYDADKWAREEREEYEKRKKRAAE